MKRKRTTPPFSDPLIDEIRAIRKELSDRFGDDWQAYGAYLRKVGEDFRSWQRSRAATGQPRVPPKTKPRKAG